MQASLPRVAERKAQVHLLCAGLHYSAGSVRIAVERIISGDVKMRAYFAGQPLLRV
jgi:hypothetical protein